jgi:hypothetical protein
MAVFAKGLTFVAVSVPHGLLYRRGGLPRKSPQCRLKVLKLRSGERGGVSPLILLVPTCVSGFLGNGNALIGDTLRQVRNTKNQGAYATPLACPFTNSATSKPKGGTPAEWLPLWMNHYV